MRKDYVSVIFDRRNKATECGEGIVEIYVYLGRTERKYITYTTCTPSAWKKLQNSRELANEIKKYQTVVDKMVDEREFLNIANFDVRIGKSKALTNFEKKTKRLLDSSTGFIDFMKEESSKEDLKPRTRQRIATTIDALLRYGKLLKMSDLNDINVKGFDDFMREEDKTRTDSCLNNYHKYIKKYARLAYVLGLISRNPYEHPLCHFSKGEAKERHPLSEEELVAVRKLDDLTAYEEHARDLFIFSSYTGLAYADNQNFDFDTMTEKMGNTYYIHGERLKNGHNFFTPILPPAMEVLVKYGYRLPRMSNQKLNEYLHLVESRLRFNKHLTSHVARHTFATVVLSHDVPIENVARMLGHTNISTTKIYAKVLNSTIDRHTNNLLGELL